MHVFAWRWQKGGASGEIPCKHRENLQTPRIKAPDGIRTGTLSCCEAAALLEPAWYVCCLKCLDAPVCVEDMWLQHGAAHNFSVCNHASDIAVMQCSEQKNLFFFISVMEGKLINFTIYNLMPMVCIFYQYGIKSFFLNDLNLSLLYFGYTWLNISSPKSWFCLSRCYP